MAEDCELPIRLPKLLCSRVTFSQQGREPMHYATITELPLDGGLIQTDES